MNKNIPEIRNPLVHNGTSQFNRLAEEMSFSYVQIEERNEADFLAQAEKLAGQFLFFENTNLPNGTWQSFFAENVPSNRPHKALFIAFLRLLNALNQHANGLTKRHLDFYYKEVLQFTERETKPSQVHLFFKCAKSLKEKFIEKHSKFDAGENKDGKEILFALVDELVVNRGDVAQVITRFQHEPDFRNRLFVNDYGSNLSDPDANEGGTPLFGQNELTYNKTQELTFKEKSQWQQKDEEVGIAISSELLYLEEGKRFIELSLELEQVGNSFYKKGDFIITMTSDEGWFTLTDAHFKVAVTNKKITVKIELEEVDPKVVGYDLELHEGTFKVNHPILKLTINQNQGQGYAKWKAIKLKDTLLKVRAEGVRSLVVQNEQSTLDPSKPFRPFGAVPAIGDHFYIGHSSLFNQNIAQFELAINWKDLTQGNLANHYANYSENLDNNDFNVEASFLRNKVWEKQQTIGLFEKDHLTQDYRMNFGDVGLKRVEDKQTEAEWNYGTTHGFMRLTLNGAKKGNFEAFGHKAYPQEVMRLNQQNIKDGNDPLLVLNPPYAPYVERLTLTYETTKIRFSETISDQFFHLTSLGQKEIELGNVLSVPHFFPHFQNEGECYIGLSNLELPQSVSLLFQLVEGTSLAEESRILSGIQWSYLSGDEWLSIDKLRISKDTSHNLLNTGIIRFDLPDKMDADHQVMPSGLFWLRAAKLELTAGIDFLQGVYAQAAEAIEQNADEQDRILSPNTISKLTTGGKGIAKIHQPFASFDGTSPDSQEIFYARTTERLRHKDRGIMIWDYERIVLDEFPDLFKVKCLNHTNYETEMVAGHVMMAVIPNLRNMGLRSPFQPKLSLRKRIDIYEHLRERISPFIHLRIENPIYEPIQLSFNVGFHPGYDEGFYGKKLHQEVQEFLSPWAFESELSENSSLVFGGELHKSTLLKFIEDLEYVDFVNDFNMYHIYQDPSIGELFDEAELQGRFLASNNFIEHEVNGPADKIWMKLKDENELETFIAIELRFLKGIIDLTDGELVKKFVKQFRSSLEKQTKKGVAITKTLIQIIIKSMFYVDRLIELSFYKNLPEAFIMEDVDVAIAKTGRSIMVTAEQHRIGVYRAGDYQCEGSVVIGIGFMIVEADFYVTPEKERNYEYTQTR